ncbi:hypothetical protein EsDP_00006107 [Epichloe bromicola]|uniref:Uncharacterized protein n=1 Tax=Epichloe bromicola TaxID=79588 RepID=A0ABQ0CWM0_9HYPO
MPLHILDLPVDILALILTPLLVQEDPIPLCPCGYLADSTTGLAVDPLSILLIHPAIHAISAPLFYQGNAFVLDLRWKHGPHVRRCLDEQAEDEAHLDASRHLDGPEDDGTIHRRRHLLTMRPALRRIRCLEMRIVKLRAWIDTQIVPFIKDMIVSGSLAELYIKISAAAAAAAGGSNSMFTRPPLAGLLAILRDPYLRTARLWVSASAGHGAWQPFRLPCSTSAHGAGREVKGEEAELVQIDWARIVKMLDPEGRAVAVMTGGRT